MDVQEFQINDDGLHFSKIENSLLEKLKDFKSS